jgi:hypothetical protein
MKARKGTSVRKTLLWLLLLFPCAVRAQDYRYDNVVIGPRGPDPSADVAVCTQPANTSTQPCSPLATIFSTAGGAAQANPLTTDSLGNYHFYAAPGVYTIQIYGPQVTTPIVMTDIAVGASGTGNTSSFNSALYVGGPLGSSWGVTDIMGQINAAKAAAPTGGATIYILPQTGGGCYLTNGSTTASFTTVGQYFQIIGAAPVGITSGLAVDGSCIQDQKTTAHNLFTIDWTPGVGGGYTPAAGIQNLALINSSTNGGTTQCTTNGGCGSSANAIVIGGTNGGAHKGYFANVTVQGFNNGWLAQDAGGVGWGIEWMNATFAYNTIGMSDPVGHENNQCTECAWAFNGTNVLMSGPGEFHINGGSVDSALTAGINVTNASGTIYATNVHWENLGNLSNLQYMVGIGQLYLTGGLILDDASGGTTAQSFFTFSHGSMTGFTWFGGNGGRTYTGFAFNPTVHAYIQGFNGNTAAWPTMKNICPAATCSNPNPNISASGPFSNAFQLTLSHSAQQVGAATFASVFYLRDTTVGGQCIASVDSTGANVVISNVVGAVVFVTGAPAATQIGLTYSGGSLQITGGATTGADTINYTQTVMQ